MPPLTPTLWMLEHVNIETARQKEMALFNDFFSEEQHPLAPEKLFFKLDDLEKNWIRNISVERLNIIDTALIR